MALPAGTRLGAYEIVSTLGEGGMGEVYLARDSRLQRRIALKVLHPDAQDDESARRRFGKEAQTASALNHSNIVTIFDVGHVDGLDYIAMEYVEGRTLRSMLAEGAVEFKRAIDIAAQAAAGLAAAHRADVVHRDIKPENLIVGADGHVTILDFGIAKPVEKGPALAEAETSTQTAALTRVGSIVGTTGYMSPEQAKGHAVDGRTDIFSLGVVLYESLTGTRPFAGASTIDVLHAIINTDPRPPLDINPRLPDEIREVLDKALAKDAADRYRDAGDLALDLRRLKRAFEIASLPSQRYARLPEGVRPPTWHRWIAAGGIGLALASAGLWLMNRPAAPQAATAGPRVTTLTPLTTDDGFEGDPSFSPDGETLAYASDRTGNFEIFIKQISGGADINISNDPGDDVQPSFSPDGRQVAFVSTRGGATALSYVAPDIPPQGGNVWVMPALGGSARRIAGGGNFPSWSPDGTAVIYTSGPWFGQKLYRVSALGGDPREVPLQFGGVTPSHLLHPRFSADGRWIAFSSKDDVFVVRAEGGLATPIARGQSPVWEAQSTSLVYTNGDAGTNRSLWRIGFDRATGRASSSASPVTVGRGQDLQAAISTDGRRIAFAATTTSTSIESRSIDTDTGRIGGSALQLTNTRDLISFFDLARDGSAALFELRRGPATTIWRADATRALVQLAADPRYDHANPLWSPDGNTIAFSRRPTNAMQSPYSLWTMSADGGNPQQVVEKMGLNGLFTWMPDGRGLVHVGPDNRQLYLMDLASGMERRLTNEAGVMPVVTVSPDGAWVIYQCVVGATIDLHAVPTTGGEARIVVATAAQDYHPMVSASGRWVYYLPDHENLFRVPGPAQNWRALPPEKVSNFTLTPISFIENPQISRDGRTLGYSRGHITSDLWLATVER